MVKIGKPKSKRTPVRLRHKIEKASAAKQRKNRKLAKQNPEWRSKIKKDPGIPNLFPYKDRILEEIEQKRKQKEDDTLKRREAARALARGEPIADEDKDEGAQGLEELADDLEDMDEDEVDDSANPMAALLASARARAVQFDEEEDDDSDSDSSMAGTSTADVPDASRKAFTSIFQQVLSTADVVLYVLDARDPNSTRSRAIERQIASFDGGSKRLILILNKIDLVPPKVLKEWLVYLRRYFPTLPLRASTPAPNAKTFDHKNLTLRSTTETLLRALKSYSATQNLKRAIMVGVVGYPNVGKSSVINALTSRLSGSNPANKHNVACPVGAEAGVTTALREVKLDSKLKLLDSPGIVFPSSADDEGMALGSAGNATKNKTESQARLVLLNAVPPKQISDPIPAVNLLVQRLATSSDSLTQLFNLYGIPPIMSSTTSTISPAAINDFLIQVARKRGRLGKGGIPNIESAAMAVITDWRDGRIRGWVEAPKIPILEDEAMFNGQEVESGNAKPVEQKGDRKEIVKEWAAEFKLEGLWGDDDAAGADIEEDAMES